MNYEWLVECEWPEQSNFCVIDDIQGYIEKFKIVELWFSLAQMIIWKTWFDSRPKHYGSIRPQNDPPLAAFLWFN